MIHRPTALLVLVPTLLGTLGCAGPLRREWPEPQPVAIDARPEMAEIAALEDARSDGGGVLELRLADSDPAVRARAATALGRLAFPEHGANVTAALGRAAALDPDVGVRRAALFALGLRGDPEGAEQISALVHDEDAGVRARAVEALAKLDRPDTRRVVLGALSDGDASVRLEAAHGPHRWSRDEASADEVDAALIELLENEADPAVTMYALASLERRKSAAARRVFQRFATSPNRDVRLFAVRGLKSLAPAPEVLEHLGRAAGDADWRAACEALMGLGAYQGITAVSALGEATGHLDPHVRRTAWEALAARIDGLETIAATRALHEKLQPYWLDQARFENERSLSVRAAFLEVELPLLAKLRRLDGGWSPEQNREMAAKLASVAEREPPVVLAGLARALGRIEEDFAREALASLVTRGSPMVAGAAIEALGNHPGEWTRGLLHSLLENRDNGIRLAALLALEKMLEPGDVDRLAELYRTTRGEVAPEVRFNAVRVAQKALDSSEPSVVAAAALFDGDDYVRQVARGVYADAGVPLPEAAAVPATLRQGTPPLPGVDFPVYARNPLVEVVTSRGSMVFELFPAEAPVHVHSFLELAARGVYEGLDFHRVVPDFVIQGGDPRGDGNGGASWIGGSLRHEIGPRKYVRGSLGMPRNEDPDSGGGQIFVTHRPTPHLDGRYTIFGELRSGGAVLDAIEVGDRILSVRRP